jgi:hypothetical protein
VSRKTRDEWRGKLALKVTAADAADILRGLATAEAIFKKLGVDPFFAAAAMFKMHGEQDDLSPRDLTLIRLWELAEQAALAACFPEQDDPTGSLELVRARDEPDEGRSQ